MEVGDEEMEVSIACICVCVRVCVCERHHFVNDTKEQLLLLLFGSF